MSQLRKLLLIFGISALGAVWGPRAAGADEPALRAVDYARLARQMGGKIGFERLPHAVEPGHVLDAPLRAGPVRLGERLAGQRLERVRRRDGALFDALAGPPEAPLRVLAGAPGQNLSIAAHRGFASMALFPLGPLGAADAAGRGEGAVAILFDEDQPALGFRLHAEYADPMGVRPRPGAVRLTFYARSGRVIARLRLVPERGINALAWRRPDGAADIAAVTVETTDPGGIALDDILFRRAIPMS